VSPDAVIERARELFRQGEFEEAALGFEQVAFEYPMGHPYLAEARYYVGECRFQTGEFLAAAAEFRRVADEHSTTPYAPLALLRAGDAHLRLWRHPELDPTPGSEALAHYQELTGRYPGTDAAARAQLHVARLREWFAEKTYRNGMFYLRRGAYDSAILYFKHLVATWQDTPQAPAALLRLVEIYTVLEYQNERRETCGHLNRFYPQAEGLRDVCPATDGAGP
jgi:outer membrane protein assembly factor BamD